MNSSPSPATRAQRQQAIQARMLRNRNQLLGKPQADQKQRNIL